MKNVVNEILELENINKTIEWCSITLAPFGTPVAISFYDDNDNFIDNFKKDWIGLTYDSGYGEQELIGTIVFTDGTWYSRSEYDGSEWWEYNCIPERPIFSKD